MHACSLVLISVEVVLGSVIKHKLVEDHILGMVLPNVLDDLCEPVDSKVSSPAKLRCSLIYFKSILLLVCFLGYGEFMVLHIVLSSN